MGSATAALAVVLIGAAPAAAGTVLVTSGTGTGAGTLPYEVEHATAGDEIVIDVPQVVLEAQVPIN